MFQGNMSLAVVKTGLAEYDQESLLTGRCSLALCVCVCVCMYVCVPACVCVHPLYSAWVKNS